MTYDEVKKTYAHLLKKFNNLDKGSKLRVELQDVINELAQQIRELENQNDLIENRNGNTIIELHKEMKAISSLMPYFDENDIVIKRSALHELKRLRETSYRLERDGLSVNKKLEKYFNALVQPITSTGLKNQSGLSTPSGEPSQLSENEWHQVRSRKFKRWFGDWEQAYDSGNYSGVSRVINKKTGEPLVVYHGTGGLDAPFTKFTFDRFPINYFAESFEYAEWFRSMKSHPAKVNLIYGVFLSIKNPIDFTELSPALLSYDDFILAFRLKYGVEIPYNNALKNASDKLLSSTPNNLGIPAFWWYVKLAGEQKTWLDALKRTRFDGLYFIEHNPKEHYGEDHITPAWTIFDNNQVKLAGGRNTEFSLESNDIRMAKGGQICG